MTLLEEGIQGASQAVVVELVGGHVPKDVGAGLLGPGGDVDQSAGLTKAGGEQQSQDLAVGEFALGVGGKMAVDDGGEVELFQQRVEQGQRAEVDGLVRESRSMPGEGHGSSRGEREV
jgi:hypothetical protein